MIEKCKWQLQWLEKKVNKFVGNYKLVTTQTAMESCKTETKHGGKNPLITGGDYMSQWKKSECNL